MGQTFEKRFQVFFWILLVLYLSFAMSTRLCYKITCCESMWEKFKTYWSKMYLAPNLQNLYIFTCILHSGECLASLK